LDFIHHFVKLYLEKRSDLEEQQLHLNVGLNKIADVRFQRLVVQMVYASSNEELACCIHNESIE
jgi:dynein heavy chain 1, cytosolic